MNYAWFNLYNKLVFEAEGIPSKSLTYDFTDYEVKTVLITKGNTIGILIDDVFLSIGLNDKNPFEFDGYACYIDENNDIFVGILVPDEN